MADRETTFISRWSRRKRDPGKEDEPAVETAEAAELAGQEVAVPAPSGDPEDPGEDDGAGDPEVVAKLPDIESLDETSDFAPFMAKGVPEVLRRRALRKLWRLNPLFANLDGLNDYDEDFTDAANLLTEIKTIYKVGKGMISEETAEEISEEKAEEEVGQTAGAEGSGEEERTGTQLAESASESPAISQSTPAVPEDEAGLVAQVGPEDVTEPVPLAEDDGEAVRSSGSRTEKPRRSAVARRWGESSE